MKLCPDDGVAALSKFPEFGGMDIDLSKLDQGDLVTALASA
jgi:hypothetical protein